MKTLIKQELFKQKKQKNYLWHSLAVMGIVLTTGLLAKFSGLELSPAGLTVSLFGTPGLIVFFMVYTASQTISLEFHYGTIKNILVQNYTKKQVLFSKLSVLAGYSIMLYLVAILATLVVKIFLFPELSFAQLMGTHSLLSTMVLNTLGNFIGLWLFVSVVIAVTCVVKKGALASILGVGFYVVASMVAGMQFAVLSEWAWLKWNLFNMFNLSNQLMNTASMQPLTKLSSTALIAGNLVYVILFLLIGYWAFSKKRV